MADDAIKFVLQAKENIRRYIDERPPEEYEKCVIGLTTILREAWKTACVEIFLVSFVNFVSSCILANHENSDLPKVLYSQLFCSDDNDDDDNI